ncbi:unnamed protein product [Closterium sp. Yama58-4]|nr:unnamed protein product [Closterium sp. Yama58-4]
MCRNTPLVACYPSFHPLSSTQTPEALRELASLLLPLHFASVEHELPSWEYLPSCAPRPRAGYAGLKNAGATCYMNSVFQQLFMQPQVRQALLAFPETPESDRPLSVIYQVQVIFSYLLAGCPDYFVPEGFWDAFRDYDGQPVNLREHQDAFEFFNRLYDSLDESMKAQRHSPTLTSIFGGAFAQQYARGHCEFFNRIYDSLDESMKAQRHSPTLTSIVGEAFAQQIICRGCPHRSEREEPFAAVSVDVKGKRGLQESLEAFVQGDLLEADNAYFCGQCGKKVDALKRACIKTLPSTLIIHLKRFDFDYETMQRLKLKDRFTFPLSLNMRPFTREGLAQKEREQGRGRVGGADRKEEGREEGTEEGRDRGEGEERAQGRGEEEGKGGKGVGEVRNEGGAEEKGGEGGEERSDGYYEYSLVGVVVHSGTAFAGHYYSYIKERSGDSPLHHSRPSQSVRSKQRWLCFDDKRVEAYDVRELEKDCFGGKYSAEVYDNLIKTTSPQYSAEVYDNLIKTTSPQYSAEVYDNLIKTTSPQYSAEVYDNLIKTTSPQYSAEVYDNLIKTTSPQYSAEVYDNLIKTTSPQYSAEVYDNLIKTTSPQVGTGQPQVGEKGIRQVGEKGIRQVGEKGIRQVGEKGIRQVGEKGIRQVGEKGIRQVGEKGIRQVGEKGIRQDVLSRMLDANSTACRLFNARMAGNRRWLLHFLLKCPINAISVVCALHMLCFPVGGAAGASGEDALNVDALIDSLVSLLRDASGPSCHVDNLCSILVEYARIGPTQRLSLIRRQLPATCLDYLDRVGIAAAAKLHLSPLHSLLSILVRSCYPRPPPSRRPVPASTPASGGNEGWDEEGEGEGDEGGGEVRAHVRGRRKGEGRSHGREEKGKGKAGQKGAERRRGHGGVSAGAAGAAGAVGGAEEEGGEEEDAGLQNPAFFGRPVAVLPPRVAQLASDPDYVNLLITSNLDNQDTISLLLYISYGNESESITVLREAMSSLQRAAVTSSRRILSLLLHLLKLPDALQEARQESVVNGCQFFRPGVFDLLLAKQVSPLKRYALLKFLLATAAFSTMSRRHIAMRRADLSAVLQWLQEETANAPGHDLSNEELPSGTLRRTATVDSTIATGLSLISLPHEPNA